MGGNLIQPQALFGACAAAAHGSACADVEKNIRNPFYIGDQPGGTEVSGWFDAWTPAASVYAVRARHAGDVSAAVKFARDHRLRLVVKGGSHSYQGTSNAPDSLLVWTRAINRVQVHDGFVPRGCGGGIAPTPAVTADAGAMWIDLYHAVTTVAGEAGASSPARHCAPSSCRRSSGVPGARSEPVRTAHSASQSLVSCSTMRSTCSTRIGASRCIRTRTAP